MGWSSAFPSVLDHLHLCFVVVAAGGRGELVELVELRPRELDAVRGSILLDPRDSLGAGDRHDVVSLGQQPCQGNLCGRGANFVGDGLDLVGKAQIPLEVLAHEARVRSAPVALLEVIDGADLAGEESVTQRRVGHEADPQLM